MIIASELKEGNVIIIDGVLYKVITVDYHSGAGQMKGVVHVKLKNLVTSSITEKRFRVDEKLQNIYLDRENAQFLYSDANAYYFMNTETYEQFSFPKELAAHLEPFLTPDTIVPIEFYNGQPINILFPESVELKIQSTAPPVLESDSSVYKPAILENGMEVLVPQFISEGDIIKIEVATKKYLSRIKKG